MNRISDFFDFSTAQLRFVLLLCVTAALISVCLIIRSYTTPTPQALTLPVIVGDPDRQLVGSFVLDPNTAPADSLELLPGIGRVLADRIVEYRQHHYFEQPVEITDVDGIGPRKYEQLKPYLRITAP